MNLCLLYSSILNIIVMTDEITTISLRPSTRNRLLALGLKSESYDNLLNDMMDFLEGKEYLYNKIRETAQEE